MLKHLLLLTVLPIILITISSQESYSQIVTDFITVTIDQSSYLDGETIVISGQVNDLYSGTPVSVIVKSPINELVSIVQVSVNDDKTFSTEMTAGSSLMNTNGTYTITAQYGTVNRSAQTTFEYQTDSSQYCGVGTLYDPSTNSCILKPSQKQLTLKQKQLHDINHQITIFEKKINNIQSKIDSQQIRLDEVTLNNATQRIHKFEGNISSLNALLNIYESLLNLADNQVRLYS